MLYPGFCACCSFRAHSVHQEAISGFGRQWTATEWACQSLNLIKTDVLHVSWTAMTWNKLLNGGASRVYAVRLFPRCHLAYMKRAWESPCCSFHIPRLWHRPNSRERATPKPTPYVYMCHTLQMKPRMAICNAGAWYNTPMDIYRCFVAWLLFWNCQIPECQKQRVK